MSAAALIVPAQGVPRGRILLAVAGVGAAAVWIAAAAAAPAPAFQGWLIAFAFWSLPSVGALVWLLIQRLTGGKWGEAFAPELAPATRATPVLLLLALPLPFGLSSLYPWVAGPARVDASVRQLFLNQTAYIALGGGALAAWSLLARRLPKLNRLGAGAALAGHGVLASLVAVQAIVSVELGVTNSAAGMSLVAAQLLGGLGWAALQGVERPARRPAGDLGGLLVATALGLSYLVFMTWLVAWYSDRPNLDRYWIPRASPAWGAVILLALASGLLMPAAALGLRRSLGVRRALRWAGVGAWVGLALYAVWLFAPSYGAACLPFAALAFVAQGGLWLAAVGAAPWTRTEAGRG